MPEFQSRICCVALGMLLNLSVTHARMFKIEIKTDCYKVGCEDYMSYVKHVKGLEHPKAACFCEYCYTSS